ncbi:putative ribonuclease H protein, partial [Trifolium medium]|nr:putative ribonuclease H protein [Trifolium medium]
MVIQFTSYMNPSQYKNDRESTVARDFDFLVDAVKAKLSGWKATNLSFAGRVTLAKFVVQAIHVYSLMTIPIP